MFKVDGSRWQSPGTGNLGGRICASFAAPFTCTPTHPAHSPPPASLPLSGWLWNHGHCCWLRASRDNGGSVAVTLPHTNPCQWCWQGSMGKLQSRGLGCNDLMIIFNAVAWLHLETSLEINLNKYRKVCSCRLDHVWFQPNVNDVSVSAGIRRDRHSCACIFFALAGILRIEYNFGGCNEIKLFSAYAKKTSDSKRKTLC